MKVAIDNGQGGQPIVVSLADQVSQEMNKNRWNDAIPCTHCSLLAQPLSAQLLEKMTDISAVRFREKRKLSKRDPAIKEQLREVCSSKRRRIVLLFAWLRATRLC